MQHLLDQLVFKTADREYRWSDVVLAARVWGDWQMLERRVREDLACQMAMRKAGETLDADDVEAAADEFRYAHDLLSAEETDQWLEQWGLSADAWMDYIHRVVLRNRWERNAATLLARYAPASEEIERAIAAEAVCSGELARLARRLAGRAAVISRSIEAGDRSIDSDERALPSSRTDDAPVGGRLEGAGVTESGNEPDKVGARALFDRLEANFRRFSRQLVTPEALDDQVAANRESWTRIDRIVGFFDDQDQAREAALLLREDGELPERVAAASGAAFEQGWFYLEDLEPELRDHVLSARPGEWSGPFPVTDGYVLFLVREKVPPTLDDPDLRSRAERALVTAAVEREISKRVTWVPPALRQT